MLQHQPHGPVTPGDPQSAQMAAARATAHHGPQAPGARSGTALCLSGGGFRAALFHLGATRRLNELGILGRLRTISAVSGGAIVANLLADPRLEWPDPGAAPAPVGGFEECVAEPLRRLTGRNVRTPALLSRLRPSGWNRPDASVESLAEQLAAIVPWWSSDLRYNDRRGPVILTSATEIGYGVSWVFADSRSVAPRGRIGDHRLGYAAPPPGLRIADAVAASCAYPPFFPPMELDGRTLALRGGVPDASEDPRVSDGLLERIQLADGGIYDNLGVEPVWSDHAAVLVSDGGAVFRSQPAGSVVGRLLRTLSIAGSGQQTTRLRWLRASFSAGLLQGATWSLESTNTVSRVPGHGPLPGELRGYPAELVDQINQVRTDLDAFHPAEQHILERHGYAVADARVQRHSPELVALAADFAPPHPEVADPVTVRHLLRHSGQLRALGRR
ncbi:patatin-like phospholipase family protein [Ornithinimicrobium faecis]|uniref:patatin-like phospholipase family protein n=1 Tax=Ornithinimicrobium faecis TaxID=2934158 RepID=UPI002118B77B|nr:patatin-like phospholipase family protein [Ornithinimicrobium sp. HY1745]